MTDDLALVDAAQRETGFDDFGEWAWKDGLDALLDSAKREGDLNAIGLGILRSWVHRRLVNRLHVIDWVKHHPEVRDERIERPLIVLGMLRTGTTILCELLAADPANRPLMKWEGLSSTPPPQQAHLHDDPRIEQAVGEVEFQYQMVPALRAVHYEPGDGPTECVALLTQSFRAQDFFGLFHAPSFVEWYRACDFAPAYEYHRLSLQLLQSRAPGRWSLKAPGHMHALDAVTAVYPDARFIVTHRDPLQVVPSSASLSSNARPDSLLTKPRSLNGYFGRLWVDELSLMVERMMDFRDLQGDAGFYDLQFSDFVRDPIAAVRGAYDHFGDTLSDDAEAAMRRHLEQRPRDKYGTHRYSLDDFGIDAGEVRERFSRYVDRFSVPQEAVST